MKKTFTDAEWKELEKLGEEISKNPIPEELDRKMTRILYGVAENIPLLFEAERRDRKQRIKNFQDLIEKTDYADPKKDSAVYAMRGMLSIIIKQTEEDIKLIDVIEAIALHQIELRKDVKRLAKISSSSKNQRDEFSKLYTKIKNKEKEETEQMKPYRQYLRIMKDEIDLESKDTTKA